MKVYIKDIKPEGLQVNYEISPLSVGLTKGDYLQFIQPLKVNAFIELVNDTAIAKVKVSSRYKSYCSRTLVDVERDWTESFLLDFAISQGTEYIDIDEDIRQEVILTIPMRILCDDEIKKDQEKAKQEPARETVKIHSEEKTYQPFADLRLKERE